MSIHNMIKCSAVKLLHNIIINKSPTTIFELYKINRRSNVEIVTLYKPKTKKTEQFFVYKGIQIYNKVPRDIKAKMNFKHEIKSTLKWCQVILMTKKRKKKQKIENRVQKIEYKKSVQKVKKKKKKKIFV